MGRLPKNVRRAWRAPALLLLIAAIVMGCGDAEDYGNPYDPMNPLTAGAPPQLSAAPGDAKAVLSWYAIGASGISKYRLYRRFEGDALPTFTLVGEVPAVTDPATGRERAGFRYEFVDDGGLLNDQVDFAGRPVPYLYRMSVVDVNGVETPDPTASLSEGESLLRVWPTSRVSPSKAPDPPKIEIVLADLAVLLRWDSYEPPGDAVAYRVYGSLVGEDLRPQLKLLDEIPIAGVVVDDLNVPGGGGRKQYLDTEFARDMMTKEYLVTVLDKFGVESADTPETRRRATTPNLPPKPIRFGIDNVTTLGPGLLRVTLRWIRAPERDVAGYNIYATSSTGWRLRKTVRSQRETTATLTEESIFLPKYYVTAFDNTNRADGNFDQVYPPGYFQNEQ